MASLTLSFAKWHLGSHIILFCKFSRVAKCHGYIKILAGWGKSLGKHSILQNPFLGTFLKFSVTDLVGSRQSVVFSLTSALIAAPLHMHCMSCSSKNVRIPCFEILYQHRHRAVLIAGVGARETCVSKNWIFIVVIPKNHKLSTVECVSPLVGW